MGFISLIYVVFASIALFACVLQLIVTFKKENDLTFLIGAFLSLVVFGKFLFLVLCTTRFGIECEPGLILRISLLFNIAVFICMMGVIAHLFKEKRRIIWLSTVALLLLIFLLVLSLPDEILFGSGSTIRKTWLTYGDRVILSGTGGSVWRILLSLSTLLFLGLSGLIFFRHPFKPGRSSFLFILVGSGLIFITGTADALIDLEWVKFSYVMPLGIFSYYLILIFIPFIRFIDEINNQQVFVREEKRYQHLASKAELIVVSLNRTGHVEFINPYFYRLTGFKPEEVIGKDWFEFFIPPKEHYQMQGAFLELLHTENHPRHINPILTKDHKQIMINWFNVRTQDQSGTITGSLSIGVDISEHVEENRSLKQKLRDAEKLIEKLKAER
ncbi:MAG TPA: PAS domain-containing protein [Bacteroidales bacterium]|nr:PAS domain-containing protein [Bacteroidales bacterium]